MGRFVGPEARKFGGFQRLIGEYAKQFAIETTNQPPDADRK